MYRRRYLTLAGSTLLLAGCSGGDTEETPTETGTPAETETPTATATEASLATEDDVQTEADTETATETPSEADVAAEHLADARRTIKSAHAVYLSQGGASSIADVGPEVTGFSADRIVSECADALSTLDEIQEDPPDDIRLQESQLRSAANWLQNLAELQAAMSETVGGIESAGAAARRRLGFTDMREGLETAQDGLGAINTAEVGLGDPSVPAFESIDGIGAEATQTKGRDIYREAVAFGGMSDYLENAMTGLDDLEGADNALSNGQAGSAETQASRAADALSSAQDGVDGLGPETFQPVVDAFTDAMDAMLSIADEIMAEAREEQSET